MAASVILSLLSWPPSSSSHSRRSNRALALGLYGQTGVFGVVLTYIQPKPATTVNHRARARRPDGGSVVDDCGIRGLREEARNGDEPAGSISGE